VFDWRVLAFTMVTSLATTLFFGLRPALAGAHGDVTALLTPGSKSGNQRQAKVRSNLVVTQIAICTALLIIAAIAMRAVDVQAFRDRGHPTDHLLLADINFEGTGYSRESQFAFGRQLSARLSGAAGIKSVSMTNNNFTNGTVHIREDKRLLSVRSRVVDEGYFRTLRVPLVAGRDFTARDDETSAPVGIVNQKTAAWISGSGSPIGQTILADGTLIEIVGVTRDIVYAQGAEPYVYRPLNQVQSTVINPRERFNVSLQTVTIHFSGDAGAATRTLIDTVSELDPSLLVLNAMTMDEQRERQLRPARIFQYAMAIPGMFTLLLGVVGTYGTMAFLAAQRRREVGIRIALGAHPAKAVRLMLVEGIRSASIGIVLGSVIAGVLVLWLSRNITDIAFFDPAAWVGVIVLIIMTVVPACYIPAKRASRVDPIVVLRED
jgi:predicted permease